MTLPRSSPAAQGVDALGLLGLLDAVQRAGHDLHSLMVVRHGHVVAEGWWAPFRPGAVHLLYSLSKSFTSSAIGLAEGERLLSLDDRIVSFFPDQAPVGSPALEVTVRDLLVMASGHDQDTWSTIGPGPDIVRSFLAMPINERPGKFFCYNQGCTYVLSSILRKLTGGRLVDYLQPRLFGPLGIDQAYWLQTREGTDQGFSGLHVVTESIAKLGQLYLQKGNWEGRQLLAQSYVSQATSKQVSTEHHSVNPDWQQGYGFQFWMCRNGAYRGDGALGQFCVVVPDADAVVVCTAQVEQMQAQLDLFWEHVLPAMAAPFKVDHGAEAELASRLSRLSTAVVGTQARAQAGSFTFTRSGERAPYTAGLELLRVRGPGTNVVVDLVVRGSSHSFALHPGSWAYGDLPGLCGPLSAVALSGGWTSGTQLQVDVVWLALPHRLRLRAAVGAEHFEASWVTTPFHLTR